jgi:hypothetical protein
MGLDGGGGGEEKAGEAEVCSKMERSLLSSRQTNGPFPSAGHPERYFANHMKGRTHSLRAPRQTLQEWDTIIAVATFHSLKTQGTMEVPDHIIELIHTTSLLRQHNMRHPLTATYKKRLRNDHEEKEADENATKENIRKATSHATRISSQSAPTLLEAVGPSVRGFMWCITVRGEDPPLFLFRLAFPRSILRCRVSRF